MSVPSGSNHASPENQGGDGFWESAFQDAYDDMEQFLGKFEDCRSSYPKYEELGSGGVKCVYRSYDWKTNREVALALPLEEGSRDLAFDFIHEAIVLGKLEHPNIIPVYDTGLGEDNVPYFTMKWVRGKSLENVLREQSNENRSSRDIPRMLDVFKGILQAISYAHSLQVVHLDVKPANVLLGDYGEVFLCDWGLANDLSTDKQKSRVVERSGTPGYVAPERILGEPPAKTMDVYSLGCLLFHMFSGRAPVASMATSTMLVELSNPDFDPLHSRHNESVPDSLLHIVEKCCQQTPADRYQEVAEIIEDLELYTKGYAPRAEQAGVIKNVRLFYARHLLSINLLGAFLMILATITVLYIRELKEQTRIAQQEKQEAQRLAESLGEMQEKDKALAQQLINSADLNFLNGHYDSTLTMLEDAMSIGLYEDAIHLRLAQLHMSEFHWDEALNSLASIEIEDERTKVLRSIYDEFSPKEMLPEQQFQYSLRCNRKGFGALYQVISTKLMARPYDAKLKERHVLGYIKHVNNMTTPGTFTHHEESGDFRIYATHVVGLPWIEHLNIEYFTLQGCRISCRLPEKVQPRYLLMKDSLLEVPLVMDLSELQYANLPKNRIAFSLSEAPKLKTLVLPEGVYEDGDWSEFSGTIEYYTPTQAK